MVISVTLVVIAITCLVSIPAMQNRELFSRLLYSPYQVYHRKEYYRLLTHALLHSGWVHLFVNMYVLYIFGRTAEFSFSKYAGSSGLYLYFLLYLGGVLFASLPAIRKQRDNVMYNSVGASGAVSAVLFSCIAFAPTMGFFIFLPIPIPAFIFGILYLIYEAYMDKNSSDYVAHDAHYYGAIFGILFTFLVLPSSFLNFIDQLLSYIS